MFTRDTCVTPSTSTLSPGFCLAFPPTQACSGSFLGRRPRAAEKTKPISHRFLNQIHLVLTFNVIVYQCDLEWVLSVHLCLTCITENLPPRCET